MKIEKRHLNIALVVLALTLVYNAWTFFRPARSIATGPGPQPLLAGLVVPGTRGGPTDADPVTIPAPPTVDMTLSPEWGRDPFLFGGETRDDKAAVAAVAPAPDPVVRSILFSAGRRLALVDGRIVGIGERVGSNEVVDIERAAVVIKTASGERRRLNLHEPARPGLKR